MKVGEAKCPLLSESRQQQPPPASPLVFPGLRSQGGLTWLSAPRCRDTASHCSRAHATPPAPTWRSSSRTGVTSDVQERSLALFYSTGNKVINNKQKLCRREKLQPICCADMNPPQLSVNWTLQLLLHEQHPYLWGFRSQQRFINVFHSRKLPLSAEFSGKDIKTTFHPVYDE